MFDSMVELDGEAELDPPDFGDWEPIPAEVWKELDTLIPFWAAAGDLSPADQPVQMAMTTPLGPHTLRLLQETPVREMSDDAKAWALRRCGELISHLEAFRAELTASLAGPRPKDPREDWGTFEVAVARKCSVYAADREVSLARSLASRLSATQAAMVEGRITHAQARALVDGVAHLPDEIAQRVEEKLLRFSHRQDLPKFKASLQRWLARLDPSFKERAEAARRDVVVEHTANDDGTGSVYLRGPLEKTAMLDTALRAYASSTKAANGGTSDERKLDGLVAWSESYLTSAGAPRRHGRAFGLNVLFDAPTMFGLADHPAEIPGYGMVPAEAAFRLLSEGSPLRKLVIDPDDGHLLSYGTKTYLVPPPLADYLIALHRTSASPHSNVPAEFCDMEHNLPHDEGGTTDPQNNSPTDRRWHRAKTHTAWSYVKNKDGSVTWTSPNGLTEIVYPHDYRLGP
jgi:hypothetical protein